MFNRATRNDMFEIDTLLLVVTLFARESGFRDPRLETLIAMPDIFPVAD